MTQEFKRTDVVKLVASKGKKVLPCHVIQRARKYVDPKEPVVELDSVLPEVKSVVTITKCELLSTYEQDARMRSWKTSEQMNALLP